MPKRSHLLAWPTRRWFELYGSTVCGVKWELSMPWPTTQELTPNYLLALPANTRPQERGQSKQVCSGHQYSITEPIVCRPLILVSNPS